MSSPDVSKSQQSNANPNPKKLIIIKRDRENLNSAHSRTSVLTYKNGQVKIQCNWGKDSLIMNKEIIDKTVKNIKDNIIKDMASSQFQDKESQINNNIIMEKESNYICTNQSKDKVSEHIIVDDQKDSMTKKSNENNINLNTMNCPHITTNGDVDDNSKEKTVEEREQSPDMILNNIWETIPVTPNKAKWIVLNSPNEEKTSEDNKKGKHLKPQGHKENERIKSSDLGVSKLCIICGRGLSTIKLLKASEDKKHFFCRKCWKNYYEDKIEEGVKDLKCPIFKCQCFFHIDIVQQVISDHHFTLLKGDEKFYLKQKVDSLAWTPNINNMKAYTQRHVIDISTNENFYWYNKAKDEFCPKCGEHCLFGKSNINYIKCWNCFHCICKYCMKDYNDLHFDLLALNHCKVYSRSTYQTNILNKKSFCFQYLIELFFTVTGYILMFIGLWSYIGIGLNLAFGMYNRNMKGGGNTSGCSVGKCVVKFVLFLLRLILFFCLIPVLLVTFPFFSVGIAIFP